ncbi:hypothetical protein [Kouleothrix sp.]|uniref:hypothetical protein n=1 Tax=Kouleothrix sp. TaxID=2779161 RepID=UPI00391A30F6
MWQILAITGTELHGPAHAARSLGYKSGPDIGEFNSPYGIAVDHNGLVYLADAGKSSRPGVVIDPTSPKLQRLRISRRAKYWLVTSPGLRSAWGKSAIAPALFKHIAGL